MWSMHTPGSDLVCKDPDVYEIVVLKTTHLVNGKSLSMACCKKIESTTTTTTLATTTIAKTTTVPDVTTCEIFPKDFLTLETFWLLENFFGFN